MSRPAASVCRWPSSTRAPARSIAYERYIELVHPDDRATVHEVVGRSRQTGEPFTFDHRAITADGIVAENNIV